MTYIWFDFTKHVVPVVPDTVEPQHISVQLQKLSQFVVCGWRGVAVLRLAARLHIWVHRLHLWFIQVYALTSHELLEVHNMKTMVNQWNGKCLVFPSYL